MIVACVTVLKIADDRRPRKIKYSEGYMKIEADRADDVLRLVELYRRVNGRT